MSVPIQTSSPDELKGGEHALASDPQQYSRCGFTGSQVFPLTGRPGKQVDNDVQASTVSPNNANGAASCDKGDVSNMNVGSGRGISVKEVDARNICGSHKGDTRSNPGDTAKSSLTQAAVGAGSPRGHVGQFPNGKNDAVNGSFGKDFGSKQYPTPDNGD
jgi:hypothetical protein